MKTDFFEYLEDNFENETIPHAILLNSNSVDITSKKLKSFLFSKKIIKNENYENNLNFIVIEPQEKEILADQISYLQSRFSVIPSNDKYNVYIIKNADQMNTSASNKLLKFLEEPQSSTLGFLLCSSMDGVLDTIQSRCQIFSISEDFDLADDNETTDLYNYVLNGGFDESAIKLKLRLSSLERYKLIKVFNDVLYKIDQENSISVLGDVYKNIILLDRILHLLKTNVNIDLVLDTFFMEKR